MVHSRGVTWVIIADTGHRHTTQVILLSHRVIQTQCSPIVLFYYSSENASYLLEDVKCSAVTLSCYVCHISFTTPIYTLQNPTNSFEHELAFALCMRLRMIISKNHTTRRQHGTDAQLRSGIAAPENMKGEGSDVWDGYRCFFVRCFFRRRRVVIILLARNHHYEKY